jgi:acetyl-CoA C-acetyltransferase
MAESIKDKVAIVGMGCTKFGERWNADAKDMITEAVDEALQDAGVELKQIEAIWQGTQWGTQLSEGGVATGTLVSGTLQTQYIPVTRVENACGTGAESLRGATFALAAKGYDLVMAVGVEKCKDMGFGGLPSVWIGRWEPVYGAFGTGPGRYAMAAVAYFAKYGLSNDEGKRVLAEISVKSHSYGAKNPKAHLRREVTIEQVLNAPMIAWPLGLFDCCGVTDGASAAILCRAEDAKKYRKDPVNIKGFGMSASPGWGKERIDYDFTYWDATQAAAKSAYAEAGIKNPRKELDMVELHDCFSIAELIASESMQLCDTGKFKEQMTATRAYYHDGEMPVNISGGLKSFGHPIGASGCREVYEIYKQIQGKADTQARQVKDVKLGLAHNQGGHPGKFICGVTVVGQP